MWIVVNAPLLFNIAVASGRFDDFREWLIRHVPDDRRIVLVVIGFCFGCPRCNHHWAACHATLTTL